MTEFEIIRDLDDRLTDGDSLDRIEDEYDEDMAELIEEARRLVKNQEDPDDVAWEVIHELDMALTDGIALSDLMDDYDEEMLDLISDARKIVRGARKRQRVNRR